MLAEVQVQEADDLADHGVLIRAVEPGAEQRGSQIPGAECDQGGDEQRDADSFRLSRGQARAPASALWSIWAFNWLSIHG